MPKARPCKAESCGQVGNFDECTGESGVLPPAAFSCPRSDCRVGLRRWVRNFDAHRRVYLDDWRARGGGGRRTDLLHPHRSYPLPGRALLCNAREGPPVFATHDLGVKVWETSYTPFGQVHTSTGGIDLHFPGQWFQAENGLHQNWMRDYDPTTER